MQLLQLPREIRDSIALHTLKSSTGILSIAPVQQYSNISLPFKLLEVNDHGCETGNQVTMALARACWQMYAECKDLLKQKVVWKLNTFYFEPTTFHEELLVLTPTQHHQIQRIKLRYDVLSIDIWQECALSTLGMLAQEGNLKSVELCLVDPEILDMGFEYRDPTARIALQTQLKALERRNLKDVQERRITSDTKAESEVERYLKHITAFDEPLRQVYEAFGGKLWVDGVLKY
ncbi:hypothetical protein BDZ45DRAFT_805546 [Acephala macrosclerotiorum]|nr:hypothetical protein BDZ45DRAFT_805546 [Acephala macrosclerotiorum]